MPVTINGNGSITGLSVGGLGSGVVNTATLADGAASGSKLTMPAGSLLQTVRVNTTPSQQIASNSTWTDTALTLNITPQFSNSLIFLTCYCRWGNDTSSSNGLRLYKDNSSVIDGNNDYLHNVAYNIQGNRPCEDGVYAFFDTAGGTSAINYKIQIRVTNGHFTFNGRGGETNSGKTSYLIAQELKV